LTGSLVPLVLLVVFAAGSITLAGAFLRGPACAAAADRARALGLGLALLCVIALGLAIFGVLALAADER
jgi:hypothetical protein